MYKEESSSELQVNLYMTQKEQETSLLTSQFQPLTVQLESCLDQ